MSLPAISRHLKVLEQAGLIERGRDAQTRPSRLRAEPLDDAVRWMETPQADLGGPDGPARRTPSEEEAMTGATAPIGRS